MGQLFSHSILLKNANKVLDKKRRYLFPKLSVLSKEGFYLAGGTALALALGHRTSLDFDFYRRKPFNGEGLYKLLEAYFKQELRSRYLDESTLGVKISGVELTCFYYNYKLIKPLLFFEGVKLASPQDIAAMKTAFIVGRAKKRDYFDIYFLLKIFSLEKILKFTNKKYPSFETFHVMQALTFFEEADHDEEEERFTVFDKSLTWSKVKDYIFKQVKTYQLSFAKKKP